MAIMAVPVRVNGELRPSRLMTSLPAYLKQSVITIIRIFAVYRPFRFFAAIGLTLFAGGFLIGLRFLWYYVTQGGAGHLQSLILAAVLLVMGFQTMLAAFLADLLAANRRLLEDLQYRLGRRRDAS